MRSELLALAVAASLCAGCATTPSKVATSKLLPVEAKSTEGTFIGHYKEGDRVIIQYVSGTWGGMGLGGLNSPDDKALIGDYTRCGIYRMQEKTLCELTIIPGETSTRPFEYTFRDECDAYLRCHDCVRCFSLIPTPIA